MDDPFGNVPFIDIHPLIHEVAADALQDFSEILKSGEFVSGPFVTRFERLLEDGLGVKHAVACASGTDALVLALRAAGVTRGMKVALPNLTFWATYEAACHVGATPVLIDIDADDLQMSFDAFRSCHDKHRFDAAILVHLFGWSSARVGEFRTLCNERSIALVEDAAQAYGVRAGGMPLLTDAKFATLSFYPAKVIGGVMDGGAVIAKSAEDCQQLRALRDHGRSAHYVHDYVGWNSRMGGLQAAYLSRVCALSDKVIDARRKVALFYRDFFSKHPHVKVYGPPAGVVENGYLNVMTCATKPGNALTEALSTVGIGTGRTYPQTIDAQRPAHDAIRFGDLAVSRDFCTRVFNLPLFYGINLAQAELAATELLNAIGAS